MKTIRITLALVGALIGLAACGSSSSDKTTSAAKAPAPAAKAEGTLNLVNWEGYADKSYVKAFEAQSGCQVKSVPAGTSDEMYTKFRSGGGSQYDLASFSGDASLRAISSGAVAPLDVSRLEHFKDLAPQLQSPPFNTVGGKHYGLSFMWGANVLIYDKSKVKTAPDSWSVLYDPANKGKITVPDNPIQIADPALQFLGAQDPYAIDSGTLAKAVDKLKQQRPLVRKYWVLASDFEQLFKSGDVSYGAGWPLMTNDLRKAGMDVGEVIPKEGVTGWSDSWYLSAKAKHPVCAYKFMNYMTTPKVQKAIYEVTGYSPANTKTCDVVGPKLCKELHITDQKYYSAIKYWQTPTKPTNYREWTDAWAEVRG